MIPRLTIDGGEGLDRGLGQLSARVSKTVQRKALLSGGEQLRSGIARRAPREPGAPDLQQNINLAPVRGSSDSAEVAVGIGVPKGFFYDTKQEFGTSRHGAQPFYRPAIDSEGVAAVRQVVQELWAALASRGIQASTPTPQGGSGDAL